MNALSLHEGVSRLKQRFAPLPVAVWANHVRWFGALGLRFQRVSERPSTNFLKLIALLLAFPRFKVSNVLFEGAFLLKQRDLLALGRESALLSGQNYGLEFNDFALNLGHIAKLQKTAREVACHFQARDCCSDCQIDHAVSLRLKRRSHLPFSKSNWAGIFPDRAKELGHDALLTIREPIVGLARKSPALPTLCQFLKLNH